MQSFQSLAVWQKAHALTLAVYSATESFPKSETFGLSTQLRRQTMAIPLSIAQGCGQSQNSDFFRCLQHARGVAVEAEYLLLLAHDLRLLEATTYNQLTDQLIEVRRMLSGFMKSLTEAAP